MKIKLHLSLYTDTVVGGGESPPIIMFTRRIEFELTAAQFIDWSQDGYFQVGDLNFRPTTKDLKYAEHDLVEGHASHYILRQEDSMEYYNKLFRNGWVPCFDYTCYIRANGYPNFYFCLI